MRYGELLIGVLGVRLRKRENLKHSTPSGSEELSKPAGVWGYVWGFSLPPLVWTKAMCAYFPFLLFTVVASVFCLPFYCFSEWYGLVSADRLCTALNHLQIELCALCVFLEQAALDCVVPA